MTGSQHKAAASRRSEIIAAARRSFINNGIGNTNVKTITDEAGVTRTLFYHYFKDKADVTEAVLEDSCDNTIEALREWHAGINGNVDSDILALVQTLRNSVSMMVNYRRISIDNDDATLYLEFSERLADRVSKYLTDVIIEEYLKDHETNIEHISETVNMFGIGFIGFLRMYPDTPDQVLADIIIQTLHL